MNSRLILLTGRVIGVVVGLVIQATLVSPALGPGPLVIVAFIVLLVGGLLAGDWVTRALLRRMKQGVEG